MKEIPRLVLMAVEDAGDHTHVHLLRERFTELGQQLRSRFYTRPVVLVQDEQPRSARCRHPHKASLLL
jgi:hypothetical protein